MISFLPKVMTATSLKTTFALLWNEVSFPNRIAEQNLFRIYYVRPMKIVKSVSIITICYVSNIFLTEQVLTPQREHQPDSQKKVKS
jgi:hypothetical protein